MKPTALPRRPFRRLPRRWFALPALTFAVGAALSPVGAASSSGDAASRKATAAAEAEVAAATSRIRASGCVPPLTSHAFDVLEEARSARARDGGRPAAVVAAEPARLALALAPWRCPPTALAVLLWAANVDDGTTALVRAARDPAVHAAADRAARALAQVPAVALDVDALLDRERDVELLGLAPALAAPLTRAAARDEIARAIRRHAALHGLCPAGATVRCARALERNDGGAAVAAVRGWLDGVALLAALPAEVAAAGAAPVSRP